MTTKEIKNWEWIKSVEVQYMEFLTQYLETATDSKGFVELMKQLRLDEAIAYLKDDLGKMLQNQIITNSNSIPKQCSSQKKKSSGKLLGKGSMPEIEQLKGKELLDTLEALRTILHPTVRALLESYIIDMVMPIPGIISFLLIVKPKQEIEPGTVISRIRYLMEGCIDHEPTSLLKEYHIHLNAQPKEGQENPSIIQIILISKKLTTITIIIILNYERIYISHQQTQFKSKLIILQG